MTDLAVTEADMQSLSAALVTALVDLGAVRRSLQHMNLEALGAPPLLEEETTYTRTRYDDVTEVGQRLSDRRDEVDHVGPTLRHTDQRLAHNSPRTQ
ncbi:hypothetical protein [Actinacidiphila acidipaludis]|uniref:Flagellar protein FlgN n=1 Tax=Actinacidiphila acidipaludis TaxID=2873382 RepID=A0ABS7QJ26_9ACTN|nr:hypothetical protein [Streptomyces acidipaludis]MBY8883175.1 hypothetical protein [Streptomyces acidipaludis]